MLEGLTAHKVRIVQRDGGFLTFRLAEGPDVAPWCVRIETVTWRLEQGPTVVVGSQDEPATWMEHASALHARRLAPSRRAARVVLE